jgi:phosphoribosylformimino-5-aminoimidazole carboxamide ribonucleotide (ProFAR) isomerase
VETVILFPAIDLKDGVCVRLKKGEMDDATVYNTDPGAQAAAFEAMGFSYLHVVDLNGAFAGSSQNGGAVDSILNSVSMPVQLGGGIRDHAAIDAWLDKGIARVILGTIAVRDPDLVRERPAVIPAKSSSVSTRVAGKWRLKAGRKPLTCWPSIWRKPSRMPASRPSSTPTSTVMGC